MTNIFHNNLRFKKHEESEGAENGELKGLKKEN